MDKVLIRQHLNTLSLVMNHLSTDIERREDTIKQASNIEDKSEELLEDISKANHYLYILKEAICDLDTIRQEYQKELDK